MMIGLRTRMLCACLVLLAPYGHLAAEDYPCWQGSSGGATGGGEAELVERWEDARLAWVNAERLPIGYESGWSKSGWPRGGFAAPAVADGRVYLYYFRPTGTAHGSGGRWSREYGKPEMTLIDADDVVLCVDLASGETLWQRIMPGQAINWGISGSGAPHLTPCVFAGRVYVVGAMGRIHCLDAVSGETVWTGDLGRWTELWQLYEDYCLATGTGPEFGRIDKIVDKLREAGELDQRQRPDPGINRGSPGPGLNFCPTWADGVLVIGDWGGGRSLLGLDGRTGERLWQAKNVKQACTSPIRWRHGERTYLLARTDTLNAIDPRSGEVLWREPADHRYTGGSPVVGDGYAVVRGEHGLTCFRIAPQGAERVWFLENRTLATSWCSMAIADGYLHYVVQLRHVQRMPQDHLTEAMHAEMKKSGGGLKWSGLVSVELATGTIQRAYSGQDRNVNAVAAGGRVFTDLGMYDVGEPGAPRYCGDFTVRDGKVVTGRVGQGRGGHDLRGGGWIAPAYVDGTLVVRGFSPAEGCHRLFCLDLRAR